MRKPFCGALDEILRDCEVSRGGGDIPTTCISFIFHLFFSLLQRKLHCYGELNPQLVFPMGYLM